MRTPSDNRRPFANGPYKNNGRMLLMNIPDKLVRLV
jgi:hypothetical protein